MIPHRHSLFRLMTAAIVGIAWPTVSAELGTAAEPWEWRPYRVALQYESADGPLFSESFVTALREAVEQRLQAGFAGVWQIASTAEADPAKLDKRFVVRLRYEQGRYQVSIREEDVPLASLGPEIVRASPLRDAVAELIATTIGEAFRPVVRIDEARNTSAIVRLRAEALYPPEMQARRWGADTAWLPFASRLDRDGRALETQPIRWTLLVTQERRDAEATCTVQSGLINPLGVRRRGRTERYALAAGPASGETRVRFTSRDGRPLAGCRVYVDAGGEANATSFSTDDDGAVTIPNHGGRPVTLVVTSRFKPLAKLPLVPGLEPEMTAAIAGEPDLLRAEERLVAWQTKFYDEFLEHRVLLMLTAAQLEQEKLEAATKLLARLDARPTLADRRAELESLGRRLAAEAGRSGPTVAALFAEAAAAIAAVDDAPEIADLRRLVAKLKPAAPSSESDRAVRP